MLAIDAVDPLLLLMCRDRRRPYYSIEETSSKARRDGERHPRSESSMIDKKKRCIFRSSSVPVVPLPVVVWTRNISYPFRSALRNEYVVSSSTEASPSAQRSFVPKCVTRICHVTQTPKQQEERLRTSCRRVRVALESAPTKL
jgi:hypothetical protein